MGVSCSAPDRGLRSRSLQNGAQSFEQDRRSAGPGFRALCGAVPGGHLPPSYTSAVTRLCWPFPNPPTYRRTPSSGIKKAAANAFARTSRRSSRSEVRLTVGRSRSRRTWAYSWAEENRWRIRGCSLLTTTRIPTSGPSTVNPEISSERGTSPVRTPRFPSHPQCPESDRRQDQGDGVPRAYAGSLLNRFPPGLRRFIG